MNRIKGFSKISVSAIGSDHVMETPDVIRWTKRKERELVLWYRIVRRRMWDDLLAKKAVYVATDR